MSSVPIVQIVWDPVKKSWIDMDSDSREVASVDPPPKDSDLKSGALPAFGAHYCIQ